MTTQKKPATLTHRDKILRPLNAADLFNVSRTTFWRYAKRPGFPCKIRLGEKSVGWLESELMAWLESRKEASQ
jgi:prophage regulatory protein